MSESKRPDYLVVGRVVGAHGLKGAFRVDLDSDFPQQLRRRKVLYLGESFRMVSVRKVALRDRQAIVEVEEISTLEMAESIRGDLVYVPITDAARLPSGEHFWHEIVGLRVETADGRELGRVIEILRTGANDVYLTRGPAGEVLVPAIADVVEVIDVASGKIVVRLLPGMLPGED